MSKEQNYHVYDKDEVIKRLAEEYKFLGRHIKVEPGHLTVLALPPAKPKKKKDDRHEGKSRVSENTDDEQTRRSPQPDRTRRSR